MKVKDIISVLNSSTVISVVENDEWDTIIYVSCSKLGEIALSVIELISELEIDNIHIINDVMHITVK